MNGDHELSDREPARMYDRAVACTSTGDVLGVVEALCARETRDATEWAARIAGEVVSPDGPAGGRRLVRWTAWRLARRPSRVALEPLFAGLPERLDRAAEFRACLLQEMALRFGLDGGPYVAYRERLAELGHPLAWLPLASLDFERRLRDGGWTPGSMLGSLRPAQLRSRYAEVPPTAAGAAAGRGAREVREVARGAAVVAPFGEEGVQDVRFYVLPGPLDPVDWNAALLAGLPAPCLEGTSTRTMAAVHTTADDVLCDLFVAAFGGGVWGEPRMGAYGRLLAWRGLYALMGLGAEVSPYDAVRRAAEHRWLRFAVERHGGNDWFFGDLTDIAFAVLDPGRTRVVVLAHTETD
ncbi:DUF6183 family protein [Streptomyces sp. CB03238]|uniref:DUF6183 family protein n=1 Tax=Streptomyces sp. CB03238 TaxID=1907777 RepID=UPI0011813BBE|nr:DUF6183 family protein [Streptomyces sp. CB03238]